MTLKTELPTNSLLPLTTIQQQTQNILPTRIYRQLKYTANDNKLPTTISVSEENFSLAEKIESVPVHFEDKMYQYSLSQNRRPPTANVPFYSSLATIVIVWHQGLLVPLLSPWDHPHHLLLTSFLLVHDPSAARAYRPTASLLL
jgi:hypothetical protein